MRKNILELCISNLSELYACVVVIQLIINCSYIHNTTKAWVKNVLKAS